MGVQSGDYAGGKYGGFPGSAHWKSDSRPLSEATGVLRSFVLQNIVQDNQWELDRITKYYLYWKFYEGMHYKDFNDGMLSFNYVRAFIDKVNMFLLGEDAFTFNVQSYYTTQIDKKVEKICEELMMYHWAKSGKANIAYEMLQMGGITGDVWVGVNWEDEGEFCKVSVYDSRQCFPIFTNGDFNKLESFLVRQPLDTKNTKYKLQVIKFTKTTIETWKQKDVSMEEASITKYDVTIDDNPYNFIPIVHIKNKPNSSGYYGKSDATDILKLNKVYNEMTQQMKAIIDYHATPTTVVTGASAKSLQKGLGQIWSGLPAEANVFNLGLDVDLSAVSQFVLSLKTAMHELSDVPENALGKIQAISNTSAAALQITYHPLMQQANMKALTYGQGITTINNFILRILEKEKPQDTRLVKLLSMEKDFLTEMRVVPVFEYGFPKDKLDELNKAQMEVTMKLSSRREIMERIGKQNIPELLKEIDDDILSQAMLQVKINKLVVEQSMQDEMGADTDIEIDDDIDMDDITEEEDTEEDTEEE